jgi:hypothetical protein
MHWLNRLAYLLLRQSLVSVCVCKKFKLVMLKAATEARSHNVSQSAQSNFQAIEFTVESSSQNVTAWKLDRLVCLQNLPAIAEMKLYYDWIDPNKRTIRHFNRTHWKETSGRISNPSSLFGRKLSDCKVFRGRKTRVEKLKSTKKEYQTRSHKITSINGQ